MTDPNATHINHTISAPNCTRCADVDRAGTDLDAIAALAYLNDVPRYPWLNTVNRPAMYALLTRVVRETREGTAERCQEIAQKEADYWETSDSYKEHPTARWQTAQDIVNAIKYAVGRTGEG